MADNKEIYQAPVLQTPSVHLLDGIAKKYGMNISNEELKKYQGHIENFLKTYNVLQKYPEPSLPVKYPRTPGYRPAKEDNKFNAWYYKTDIKGAASGKLHGKTLAMKDSMPVAGVPMTLGSTVIEGYTPEYDPTIVTRILDAGGHIVGTSNCEDFCVSSGSFTCAWGPVLNPYDIRRSAGGSSSGSAVLVASKQVDMALGADQAGSVRIPASCCGIVGLKPTWGLVPYTGLASMESSLDHVGPMTNTVKDCALLLEAIAGYDDGLDARQPRDLQVPVYTEHLGSDLSGLKIGVVEEGFTACEPDVSSIVMKAVRMLEGLGAKVEDMSIPMHTDGLAIMSTTLMQGLFLTMLQSAGCTVGQKGFNPTSLTRAMHRGIKTQANQLPHSPTFMMLSGAYITETYGTVYYGQGMNLCRVMTQTYDKALAEYDVLVMPTVKFKPPPLPKTDAPFEEYMANTLMSLTNTAPFNITGHPALSINAGFSEGLPVGMMIVGKHFDDTTVLKVAHAYEQLRNAKQ